MIAWDLLSSPLQYLSEGAGKHPDRGLIWERERIWTYAELWAECQELAHGIAQKGVKRGDRVALLARGYHDLFSLMFAVWGAGGVACPMNLMLPDAKLGEVIHKLEPSFCIVDGDQDPPLGWRGPTSKMEDLFTGLSREPSLPRAQDDSVIMFTSGTTGMPKGVRNTHWAVAANSWLTAQALDLCPEDRILINTPAYYTSAIIHLLTLMSRGGGLVGHSGFLFGHDLLELVDSHRCTGFGGAPVHFSRIFASDQPLQKPDTLRFMMNSGDHLPVYWLKRALEAFSGLEIFCCYGLSEVAGRLCILPPHMLGQKQGSVGKPLPGMDITVRREDPNEMASAGEIGEIYVQGPLLMEGYWREETINRQLLTHWGFKTGDFGYVDEDGCLFLQGRRDDVFKSGGEKVSTFLIQEVLRGMDCFNDVAVAPMEDDFMGLVPCAYYVPAPKRQFDRRGVVRQLRGTLAANHIPKKFIPLAKIPRTGSGKLIRAELPKMESLVQS